MKRTFVWLVAAAVLVTAVPRDVAARPPRKGGSQITARVTTVGSYIECDVWNRFDTRAHGLPRSAKSATDCFFTRFAAANASFPIDQDHVCVPASEALISTDDQWVCAAGAWLTHNTFTALTKTGFVVCRYEAIMDAAGNVLQEIEDTCGF
jgi:hypothetical protein